MSDQDSFNQKDETRQDDSRPPVLEDRWWEATIRSRQPSPQPPVARFELLVLILLVVLADIAIYRTPGFASLSLWFLLAPWMLAIGSPRQSYSNWMLLILGSMLAALSASMVWCGREIQVVVAGALFSAFALTRAGVCPYVLDTLLFPFRACYGGVAGVVHYRHQLRWTGQRLSGLRFLNVLLPLGAFVVFGWLFLLANPDLFTFFGERLESVLTTVRDWIVNWSPPPQELIFWLAVLWLGVGSMRPFLMEPIVVAEMDHVDGVTEEGQTPSLLYAAWRNTLTTVILLFAAYLVFEFQTLWFRDFPEGFYYSGYAHQGAAWLTVALGLATVILSLVFRGQIQRDPRIRTLRRLAWLWSFLNLLLAVAVYHRLYIYIDFNGLTRMRIVGFLGMSAVLVGFLFVLGKIAGNRSFAWLIQRHLWTAAVAIYLFAALPVDVFVVSYNVRRIMTGDLAPSVQLSVQPLDASGCRLLMPLLDCESEEIREGIRALLAQRQWELESHPPRSWKEFQSAEKLLRAELQLQCERWKAYEDHALRLETLNRFHKFVYQWY